LYPRCCCGRYMRQDCHFVTVSWSGDNIWDCLLTENC
jgi:hypothetical protein